MFPIHDIKTAFNFLIVLQFPIEKNIIYMIE